MATEFKLATSPADFKKGYKFLESLNMREGDKMAFPTILAIRDGEVVGVISRQDTAQAVVVGNLAVKEANNSAILLIKLVEVWDAFLVRSGVTQYLCPVYKTNTKFLNALKRMMGMEPYAEDDRFHWFKRVLA